MSDSHTSSPSASSSMESAVTSAQSVQRLTARLRNEWLPFVFWALGRTGRTGLIGMALIAASGIFFLSTHSALVGEVNDLKDQLDAARARPSTVAASRPSDEPARLVGELPTRVEVPALLGTLVAQAEQAHLSIDTGKYEVSTTKASGVTRYHVSFPVTGAYVQVRAFIDSVLTALPAAAISELSIERKQVGDGSVEAQLRLTLYTRGAP